MDDLRRRIEAARAYGDISSQAKLADAIGMTRTTFMNRLSGRYEWRRGDLLAIAEKTGVPVWFLERGWEGAIPVAGLEKDDEGAKTDALVEDLIAETTEAEEDDQAGGGAQSGQR